MIDENGNSLGEIDTKEALERAELASLDLVLVAPLAKPPVAKILDFGKFKYEQSRKDRKNKTKKSGEIKEIRLSYNTDTHDKEVKLKQAQRFLSEGHRIRLRLKLVGREIAFKDKGLEELDQFKDQLGLEYDQPIQRQGKQFSVLLKEKKAKKEQHETENA